MFRWSPVNLSLCYGYLLRNVNEVLDNAVFVACPVVMTSYICFVAGEQLAYFHRIRRILWSVYLEWHKWKWPANDGHCTNQGKAQCISLSQLSGRFVGNVLCSICIFNFLSNCCMLVVYRGRLSVYNLNTRRSWRRSLKNCEAKWRNKRNKE